MKMMMMQLICKHFLYSLLFRVANIIDKLIKMQLNLKLIVVKL